jgi:Uma2 family endonuclease
VTLPTDIRLAPITGNLGSELHYQLRETPCTVCMLRLRIATDPKRHYTFPDVVVLCDPPQYVDDQPDTVTNPKVIAEVLSDSTEKYDRGAKSQRYRAVPTLSEYLLVSQDRVQVELYTRQADGGWSLHEWSDPAAEIELVSLGCRLRVAEVYAKVDFSER